MESKSIFEEKQYFRQLWLWVILLICDAVIVYLIISGSNIDSQVEYIGLWVSCFITFGVTILIYFSCLHTKISREGISFKFFPLVNQWKNIRWQDMENLELRKYNPIKEFGGWGVRTTLEGKKAYNIAGNIGLDITLKDKKSILIGTQKPDELRQAIKQIA